jgi:hypothetical protein
MNEEQLVDDNAHARCLIELGYVINLALVG